MRPMLVAASAALLSSCCLVEAIDPPSETAPVLAFLYEYAPSTALNISAVSDDTWRAYRAVIAAAGNGTADDILLATVTSNDDTVEFEYDAPANSAARRLRATLTVARRAQVANVLQVGTAFYFQHLDGSGDAVDADALQTYMLEQLSQASAWTSFAAAANWGLTAADFASVTPTVELGPPAQRPVYNPFGDKLQASDVGGIIGSGIVLVAIFLMWIPNAMHNYKMKKAEQAAAASK